MADLVTYRGPFTGTDVSVPETDIALTATPFSINFFNFLNELRSRPIIKITGNSPADFIRSFFSFYDINSVLQKVALSPTKLYSSDGVTTIGTMSSANSKQAITPVVYNGVLYFPSGNALYSYDGTAFVNPVSTIAGAYFINKLASHLLLLNTIEGSLGNLKNIVTINEPGAPLPITSAVVTVSNAGDTFPSEWLTVIIGNNLTIAGTVNYNGTFVITNYEFVHNGSAHRWDMSLVFTTIAGLGAEVVGTLLINASPIINYPQRIRWSASGLPAMFDPTVNTNAGYNDLDTAEAITGFFVSGYNGIITTPHSLIEMAPTGNGISPFAFYNIASAPEGIGNFYTNSLDSFGIFTIFAAQDDIYLMSQISGLKDIGGIARAAIYGDLINSINGPFDNFPFGSNPGPIGTIINTYLDSGPRGISSDGLYYILVIPMGTIGPNNTGNVIFWVYDLKRNCWFRWITEPNTYWLTSKYTDLGNNIIEAGTYYLA